MARRSIKREATQVLAHHVSATSDDPGSDGRHHPVSSGDTIADSDTTIQDEPVEGGYLSNNIGCPGKAYAVSNMAMFTDHLSQFKVKVPKTKTLVAKSSIRMVASMSLAVVSKSLSRLFKRYAI